MKRSSLAETSLNLQLISGLSLGVYDIFTIHTAIIERHSRNNHFTMSNTGGKASLCCINLLNSRNNV
jgi:hypothetical protein